ncbi:MAG: hypothetical protein U0996_26300 [Planctomycetaceae bacterium]
MATVLESRSDVASSLPTQQTAASDALVRQEPGTFTPANEAPLSRRECLTFPFLLQRTTDFSGTPGIVRAYSEDAVRLHTMRQQWHGFVKALRAFRLRTDSPSAVPPEVLQKAMEDVFRRMGQEADSELQIPDLKGIVTNESAVDVLATLQTSLANEVTQFARQIDDDLEALVAFRVIGQIEWHSSDCCQYHYYEHELAITKDKDATENVSFAERQDPRTVVRGFDVHRKVAGKRVHRAFRFDELLISASSRPLKESTTGLPEHIQEFVRQIPVWLTGAMDVVEGEKVSEERTELVSHEEQWEQRTFVQRVVTEFDPALTLFGEFVIVAWDELSYGREISRRQQLANAHFALRTASQKEQARVRQERWGVPLLLLYGVLSVALMSLMMTFNGVIAMLAPVVSSLTIPAVTTIAVGAAREQKPKNKSESLFGGFFAWLMGIGVLSCVFASIHLGQLGLLRFVFWIAIVSLVLAAVFGAKADEEVSKGVRS